MSRWTFDDSADLDRQIRRLRELERAALPRSMRGAPLPKARRPRPRPEPRRLPNGRWIAACVRDKQRFKRTFDTRAEAEAWLDQLAGVK